MRPAPTRGGARTARGLSAAVVCALLTYCGHMGAGGAAPDLGLLVVLGLLLAGFLVALADRRRGPLAILALVAGSQLALHGLLQLLGTDHAGMDMTDHMTDHAAMGMSADAAMGMSADAGIGMAASAMPHAEFAGPVEALLGAHPSLMLGAHALAVVVTAAILAGAEDAVFTVAAAMARVLPSIPALPPPPDAPRGTVMAADAPDTGLRLVLARRVCLRRGPPPGVAGLAIAR